VVVTAIPISIGPEIGFQGDWVHSGRVTAMNCPNVRNNLARTWGELAFTFRLVQRKTQLLSNTASFRCMAYELKTSIPQLLL
jgi:hypothetical protein